jgi:hypothetical protein
MIGKLTLLIGLGAGYVLGAREGRERYDQIAAKARQLWNDPRVQEKAGRAQQTVQEKVRRVAPAADEKVGSSSGGSSSNEWGSTTSAASAGTASSWGSHGGTLP